MRSCKICQERKDRQRSLVLAVRCVHCPQLSYLLSSSEQMGCNCIDADSNSGLVVAVARRSHELCRFALRALSDKQETEAEVGAVGLNVEGKEPKDDG